MLGWLTEFSGFLLIFFGSYILGHGNSVVTLVLQSLTIFIYYIIVPCIYLINDSDFKADIAETETYFNFLKLFKSESVDPKLLDDEENENGSGTIQRNPDKKGNTYSKNDGQLERLDEPYSLNVQINQNQCN